MPTVVNRAARRMSGPTVWTFLLIAALCAAVMHLAESAVVAMTLDGAYRHRVFDVTRATAAATDRYRLLGSFLKSRQRMLASPSVTFAGSSFTFGYPWPESMVFSRLFASERPDVAVLNVSMLSADVASVNDWILCAAVRNDVRFDTLVVELPVVNSLSRLATIHRLGLESTAALADCRGVGPSPGYFAFALRHPLAVGWIPFLVVSGNYTERDLPVALQPVPKGYFVPTDEFATVKDWYGSIIDETLRRAQSIARTVYAYPSPVYVGGMQEIGSDPRAMDDELAFTVARCKGVGGVRCLDPSPFYRRRGDYYNVTHLNQHGHRDMAAWFAREIR